MGSDMGNECSPVVIATGLFACMHAGWQAASTEGKCVAEWRACRVHHELILLCASCAL